MGAWWCTWLVRATVDSSPHWSITLSQEKKSNNSGPGQTSAEKTSKPSQDVVLIHGVTDDKKGLRVLRARPEGIELGEVRPIQEGQPLNHDLVRLQPREGTPHICDVHTEFSMSELSQRSPARALPSEKRRSDSAAESAGSESAGSESLTKRAKGPAQVATQTYRDGWDAIWASTRKPGTDLN